MKKKSVRELVRTHIKLSRASGDKLSTDHHNFMMKYYWPLRESVSTQPTAADLSVDWPEQIDCREVSK